MNGQLPVVSFRPEGHDAFMSLMGLMIGMRVEITYLHPTTFWDDPQHKTHYEMLTKRGEIEDASEYLITLKPYGLPKRYSKHQYRCWEIPWEQVKMMEVVGP